MSISGFLMFGSAQKNKIISIASCSVLAIYLVLTSTINTAQFLCLNLALIISLSMLIRKIGNQTLSAVSILIYSVLIDIICFFAIDGSGTRLHLYVLSGLLFNLKSALPVVIFALVLNLVKVFKRDYYLTAQLNPFKENILGR